jgi:hypothetical protein
MEMSYNKKLTLNKNNKKLTLNKNKKYTSCDIGDYYYTNNKFLKIVSHDEYEIERSKYILNRYDDNYKKLCYNFKCKRDNNNYLGYFKDHYDGLNLIIDKIVFSSNF